MKATATFLRMERYHSSAYDSQRKITGAAIAIYQGPTRTHRLHFQVPPHLTWEQAQAALPREFEVEFWD